MKQNLKPIAIIAIIIAVILAYFYTTQQQPAPNGQSNITPTRIAPTIDEQANIRVSSPEANDVLTLPIVIKGEARVFENNLNYRLVECDGNVLREGFTTAQSPDMGLFGPFEVTIESLPDPEGTQGCIEVYSGSPKDGSEINVVHIPVTFDVSKARTVQVYFSTEESGEDCETVSAVTRYVSSTPAVARVALEELLRGPIQREKEQGFDTALNTGVMIQSLTIENGVARVDFDTRLEEQVGGSCRVSIIRNQIEKTLMQFSTVEKVIISIDGRTEDILQP